MKQALTAVRGRTPRRQGRQRRLAAAVAEALEELDGVDRRVPLPAEFAARVAALGAEARGLLARAGAELSIGPVEPGALAPGAALVILLKLQLALERATKTPAPGAGAGVPGGLPPGR